MSEIPVGLFEKSDPKLNTSYEVNKAIQLAKYDGDLINEGKKAERLKPYLGEGGQLEKIFNSQDEEDRQRRVTKYKEELLYPNFLIDKDNIPESYFKLQEKIARERNQLDLLDTSQEARKIEGETIYNDQKKSLDNWVDYLSSSDATYPTWFKYYTLNSISKMGIYDKEKHEFGKRNKSTTTIFPDLNREAVAYAYDVLQKYYLKQEKHSNEELQKIIEGANFSKIYAFAIEKVTPASKENKEKIEGEWVKFKQGDDATALYESLQGHGTGWCTAGEKTAEQQLANGDFYVYYTKDEQGKNVIPRIAIRMENRQVAEVRGIGYEQNLEGNMVDIAREKYRQLPGGDKFEKKDHDMKLLTLMDNKFQNNEEFSKDELIFIYEIDSRIEGFGYKSDPRIEEILMTRDKRSDLAFIFDCKPGQISLSQEEALQGDIKFHFGDIDLSNLISAKGLTLPENIKKGNLDLGSLNSAEGLILSKSIDGNLYLDSLNSAEGLILSDDIRGNLDLRGLISAEGLILPKNIGGNLNLRGLTSTEGLTLPESIEGDLYLDGLILAEGLILPKNIKGNLYLEGLTSAKGLELPENIGGSLNLKSLISDEGLVLPKNIGGNLNLRSLISANGLVLPKNIGASLYLDSLTSIKGLILPDKVKFVLNLRSLTSAEGLVLPENIESNLYLDSLSSIDGLILSDDMKGTIYLNSLNSVEKDELKEKYPKLRII